MGNSKLDLTRNVKLFIGIYGQNAIRKKHEGRQMLALAAKMDAVAARLETASKTQQISQQIAGSVPQLNAVMAQMSPEQMAVNMDQFEKIFEDLDVRTEYITNAIDSTTATSTPITEVDNLIEQVGEEHGMEVRSKLASMDGLGAPVGVAAAEPTKAAEASLEDRLAQLKS